MQSNDNFDEQVWAVLASRAFYAALEINEKGLMLGGSTVLAKMAHNSLGSSFLAMDRDRERILALLSIAYEQPVSAAVLHNIKAASDAWQGGDKALANICLAYARLPPIDKHCGAYRLYLAETLLDTCMTPISLMKALNLERGINGSHYNPLQPRDDNGRWTSGGAAIELTGGDQRDHDHDPERDKDYERRRDEGIEPEADDIGHGHPLEPAKLPLGVGLPIPVGGVPKNALVGLNARTGAPGKINTDWVGGLEEAEQAFKDLVGERPVKTKLEKSGVTITFTTDTPDAERTQLRVNADGKIRIDRPIEINDRTKEDLHFNEKKR